MHENSSSMLSLDLFKNVITREDLKKIDSETLNKIDKASTFYSNQLRGKNIYNIKVTEIRANDIAFILSKWQNQNVEAKHLLACSIAMDRDEKLINFLLKKGYYAMKIYNIANLISKLKNLSSHMNESQDCTVVEALNEVNKLVLLIKQFYGIEDVNLIITKINYLVQFKFQLFAGQKSKLAETSKSK